MPMALRPSDRAAKTLVPDPANGSSTTSPLSVNVWIKNAGSQPGKAALWPWFPHSVAPWRTLVKQGRVTLKSGCLKSGCLLNWCRCPEASLNLFGHLPG